MMAIMQLEEMPKLRPVPMEAGESIRRWEFLEDWIFDKWRARTILIPKKTIVDGASIPRIFRGLYSPTGYLLIAAIIHDFIYRRGYYIAVFATAHEPILFRAAVTRVEADSIFGEINNLLYNDSKLATFVAEKALRFGGWAAWNRYRAADDDASDAQQGTNNQ